ncbi:MAG: DNA polymerase III subunit delta' [Myxococcales bacterium]|nr:DNA polymerase III subunit delta' [Myxococcales bacterium]
MLLSQVFGQDAAVARLVRAVGQGRVPHAYLFEGPDGVGKKSTALALGVAMLCPQAPGRGCGACDVCHRALAGLHPDLRTFAPEARELKKEEADEIVALASERPHEGPARLIVVDEADRLNASAANCLLKTLEEPAAGNHLVLVTAAPARLLETIRSRTQRVRFSPLAPGAISAWLEARGTPPEKAQVAAALANGSLARASTLVAGDDDEALWSAVSRLRSAAAGNLVGPIMDAAASFAGKEAREGLLDTLDLLGRLYRDALMAAAGAPELVILGARRSEIQDVLARGGPRPLPRIRKALDAVLEAEAALAGNVNAVTAVEGLVFSLRSLEFRRGGAGPTP